MCKAKMPDIPPPPPPPQDAQLPDTQALNKRRNQNGAASANKAATAQLLTGRATTGQTSLLGG